MKSLFWMKQIQDSVRVKITEYVHAWFLLRDSHASFFSFHFLSLSISFPKLTIFTILRVYMACKMRKITALTSEISSCRLVEKFHVSAFPMYYSRYHDWIGEHEITKLYKLLLNICFESRKKGHKNKHKKTWMKWNDTKWSIWYFQQCACVSERHLFCTSSHHNVQHEKQPELNKGWALKWVSLLERVRNC